jgi:hypothetical protein
VLEGCLQNSDGKERKLGEDKSVLWSECCYTAARLRHAALSLYLLWWPATFHAYQRTAGTLAGGCTDAALHGMCRVCVLLGTVGVQHIVTTVITGCRRCTGELSRPAVGNGCRSPLLLLGSPCNPATSCAGLDLAPEPYS